VKAHSKPKEPNSTEGDHNAGQIHEELELPVTTRQVAIRAENYRHLGFFAGVDDSLFVYIRDFLCLYVCVRVYLHKTSCVYVYV
jgi:hypothetical protein